MDHSSVTTAWQLRTSRLTVVAALVFAAISGSFTATARATTVNVLGTDVGQGLEDAYTLVLSAPESVEIALTVSVDQTSQGNCQVSQSWTLEGLPATPVTVLAHHTTATFYILGVSAGLCSMTITGPQGSDIIPSPASKKVVQAGLKIINLDNSVTTQDRIDYFNVQAGLPLPTPSPAPLPAPTPTPANALLRVQRPRHGGGGVPLTVCSSDTQIGTINTQTTCPTPRIAELQNQTAYKALWFDPQTQYGTTTVSAAAPNFQPPPPQAAEDVTVAQVTTNIVGPDLAVGCEDRYTLQLSDQAGQDTIYQVCVALENSGLCRLATALKATSPLLDCIFVTVPSGHTSATFYVAGMKTGDPTGDPPAPPSQATCNLKATVSSPGNSGITDGMKGINLVYPAGLRFVSLPSTLTTGASDTFYVDVGFPGDTPATLADPQVARYGGGGFNVNVCSSNTAAGTIGGAQCQPTHIAEGQYRSPAMTFKAGTPTSETGTPVSAQGTGLTSISQDVTVAPKTTTLILPDPLAGRLEEQATLRLSTRAATAIAFKIKVKDSSTGICQLAVAPADGGLNEIQVTVPAGGTQATFYLLGRDQFLPGTCEVTATPADANNTGGFASSSDSAQIVLGGLRVNLPTSLSTANTSASFTVDSGVPASSDNRLSDTQNAQAANLNVEVCSSDPNTLRVVSNSPTPANCAAAPGCVVLQIAVNAFETPNLTLQILAPTAPRQKVAITAVTPDCDLAAGSQPFKRGIVQVTVASAVANIKDVKLGAALETQTTLTLSSRVVVDTAFTVQVDPDDGSNGLCQLAANATGPGVDSIQAVVPAGSSSVKFYALGSLMCLSSPVYCHLLVGPTPCYGVNGDCTPMIAPGDGTATIVEPGLRIRDLVGGIQTGNANDPFYVESGVPYRQSLSAVQAVRRDFVGGLPVQVCSDHPLVGQIVAPSPCADAAVPPSPPQCVTVPIPAGQSHTTQAASDGSGSALYFQAVGTDPNATTTNVTATVPPVVACGMSALPPCFVPAPPVPVTVTGSQIEPSCPAGNHNQIGNGLQDTCKVCLSTSPAGGSLSVDINVESDGVCLVAQDEQTAGSAKLTLQVTSCKNFAIQGVGGKEGQDCKISFAATPPATGWGPSELVEHIMAYAFKISGLASPIPLPAAPDPFQVSVGIPDDPNNPTTLIAQTVSPAGPTPFAVTVTSSDTNVGLIAVPSPSPTPFPGASQAAIIPASASATANGAFDFIPSGLGMTSVYASGPDYRNIPDWDTVNVTVIQGNITLTCPLNDANGNGEIGAGLEDTCTVHLDTTPASGNQTVRIQSTTPTVCVVAPNEQSSGTMYLDLSVHSSANFAVQTLSTQAGQCIITAAAYPTTNAWSSATKTIMIIPLMSRINVLSGTTTLTGNWDSFGTSIGIPHPTSGALIQQNVSPMLNSGGGYGAVVCSTNPNVGQIAVPANTNPPPPTPGPSPCQTVNIVAGQSSTSSAGYQFAPQGVGSTYVCGPGATPTAGCTQVTVSKAVISFDATHQVGAGLMDSFTLRSSATVRLDAYVIVSVSPTTTCLVAADEGSAATAQATIKIPAGKFTASYTIHGVEHAAGAARPDGTSLAFPCTVTQSEPVNTDNFTDAQTSVSIVRPVLRILGMPTSFKNGNADNAFVVNTGVDTIGSPHFYLPEPIRFGGVQQTVTVCPTDSNIGQIVTPTSPTPPPDCATATISPTSDSTAASALAFRGVGNGSVVVTATDAPDYDTSDDGARAVNVSSFTLGFGPTSPVGAGLQLGTFTVTRPVATNGSLTATVWSLSPSVCVVSASDTVAGQPSSTVTVAIPAAGTVSNAFWVQGVAVGACSLEVTEAVGTYLDPGFASLSIVQPGIRLRGVPTGIADNAANVTFNVDIGVMNSSGSDLAAVQEVSAGSSGVVATITNSNSAAAQLWSTTTPSPAQSVTAAIPAGSSTTTDVGLQFDPVATGTTAVSVTAPNTTPTTAATVGVTVVSSSGGGGC